VVSLLLYYVVIPIGLGWLVFKLLAKFSPYLPPEHVQRHFAEDPPKPKHFRAARLEEKDAGVSVRSLGDFEKLDDAVDALYAARQGEPEGKEGKVAFVAYNDRLEPVQQIDL